MLVLKNTHTHTHNSLERGNSFYRWRKQFAKRTGNLGPSLNLKLRCSDSQSQECHCVCVVWASKQSSGGFNWLLWAAQKVRVEETGSPLSHSPVAFQGSFMRWGSWQWVFREGCLDWPDKYSSLLCCWIPGPVSKCVLSVSSEERRDTVCRSTSNLSPSLGIWRFTTGQNETFESLSWSQPAIRLSLLSAPHNTFGLPAYHWLLSLGSNLLPGSTLNESQENMS